VKLSSRTTYRPAFTLIELLVVVAIVTLLLGMTLPSVSRARQTALQIHCLANIAELSRGTLFYANANDSILPTTRQQTPGRDNMIWTQFIQPILGSTDVFLCAAAPDSRFADTWSQRGWLPIGLNRNLDPPRNQMHQLDTIADPTRTILFGDSVYGPTEPPSSRRGFMIRPGTLNARECISDRHRGRTNLGFLDGHADHYLGSAVDNYKTAVSVGLRWRPIR